jgi:hypothetical protein
MQLCSQWLWNRETTKSGRTTPVKQPTRTSAVLTFFMSLNMRRKQKRRRTQTWLVRDSD